MASLLDQINMPFLATSTVTLDRSILLNAIAIQYYSLSDVFLWLFKKNAGRSGVPAGTARIRYK